GGKGWSSASRSPSRRSSSRRRCAARSRGKPARGERTPAAPHPVRPRVPSLVLVTDRHATAGRDLVALVAAALDAGLPAVQLRDKDLPGGPLFALAEQLRAATIPVLAIGGVTAARVPAVRAAGAAGAAVIRAILAAPDAAAATRELLAALA